MPRDVWPARKTVNPALVAILLFLAGAFGFAWLAAIGYEWVVLVVLGPLCLIWAVVFLMSRRRF